MNTPTPYRLKFSMNWNNKLNCAAFTTLRRHVDGRFVPGTDVLVVYKDKIIGTARVMDVRIIGFAQIGRYTAFLDTGYDLPETLNLVRLMYGADAEQKQYDLVLLRWVVPPIKPLEFTLKPI